MSDKSKKKAPAKKVVAKKAPAKKPAKKAPAKKAVKKAAKKATKKVAKKAAVKKATKKAAKKADNSVLSPIYLVQAGEILESQGKADEALKLYEQVRNNYRGSQQGQEIDKYIERASR